MSPQLMHSKVKCPKCKSIDAIITELWRDSAIQWEQRDGKFDMKDGTILPEGEPYMIQAQCYKCKHMWTIRKAIQINDIIKD